MMSPKKGKGKKGRAQTAGQSPGKMSSSMKSGPISAQYVSRGYTDQSVELDHLKTVEVEVKRERGVTESC